MWELSIAESVGGSLADSIEHANKAIDAIPRKWAGLGIGSRSILAARLARSGNLAQAEIEFEKAERTLEIARGWTEWGQFGGLWRSHIFIAKAILLYSRGEYMEAEPFYEAAIQLLEENADQFNDKPRMKFHLWYEAVLGKFALSLLRGAIQLRPSFRPVLR